MSWIRSQNLPVARLTLSPLGQPGHVLTPHQPLLVYRLRVGRLEWRPTSEYVKQDRRAGSGQRAAGSGQSVWSLAQPEHHTAQPSQLGSGVASPPAVSILPYMPFLSQYWPLLVSGAVCYLVARLLYHITAVNTPEPEPVSTRANAYKTPDQVAEILEEDDFEESDELNDDMSSALPWDMDHVPFKFTRLPLEETRQRSEEFFTYMNTRRTVRFFSADPVPADVVRNIIRTAGTAPSGAHTEPWTYVVVSSPEVKQKIRDIVEDEERINYSKRMGKKWTTDLKPLKTNWVKEYLTTAPYLILVFKQLYSFNDDGSKRIHYYNEMSVALASGILLSAIHYAGLVSLTSTPLNCGPALRVLLGRPNYEKLTLLLPIGYPAEDATVPDLTRKPLEDILIEI